MFAIFVIIAFEQIKQYIALFESKKNKENLNIVEHGYKYRRDKTKVKKMDCKEHGCIVHEAFRCTKGSCNGRLYVCFGITKMVRIDRCEHTNDRCNTNRCKDEIRTIDFSSIMNITTLSSIDLANFQKEFIIINQEKSKLTAVEQLNKWNSYKDSVKNKKIVFTSPFNQVIPYLENGQSSQTNYSTNEMTPAASNVPLVSVEHENQAIQMANLFDQKKNKSTKIAGKKARTRSKISSKTRYLINDTDESSSTAESDESDVLVDQKLDRNENNEEDETIVKAQIETTDMVDKGVRTANKRTRSRSRIAKNLTRKKARLDVDKVDQNDDRSSSTIEPDVSNNGEKVDDKRADEKVNVIENKVKKQRRKTLKRSLNNQEKNYLNEDGESRVTVESGQSNILLCQKNNNYDFKENLTEMHVSESIQKRNENVDDDEQVTDEVEEDSDSTESKELQNKSQTVRKNHKNGVNHDFLTSNPLKYKSPIEEFNDGNVDDTRQMDITESNESKLFEPFINPYGLNSTVDETSDFFNYILHNESNETSSSIEHIQKIDSNNYFGEIVNPNEVCQPCYNLGKNKNRNVQTPLSD